MRDLQNTVGHKSLFHLPFDPSLCPDRCNWWRSVGVKACRYWAVAFLCSSHCPRLCQIGYYCLIGCFLQEPLTLSPTRVICVFPYIPNYIEMPQESGCSGNFQCTEDILAFSLSVLVFIFIVISPLFFGVPGYYDWAHRQENVWEWGHLQAL